MMPTTRTFAGFVLIAGAIVLGTALLSQYWGGLAPCELCLLQRWPWGFAIAASLVILFAGERARLRWVAAVFAAGFVISAGLAFYHVGVEQHWYAGPSACTAQTGATTIEEMRRQIMATQPVLCDQPTGVVLGVSMAGWNLVASLTMAGICAAVFARARLRAAPHSAAGGLRRGAA